MKYNILGFNQEILVKEHNNLNGNDLIVLRTLVDVLPRMTREVTIDNKSFKQVTYELLLEDVPFVTGSASTLKKIVQKFINNGLIERHIENKGGKFTYFRVTEKLTNLEYKEEPKETKTKKVNVDSNGNTPIDGQITVEEAINKEEKLNLVKEIITSGAVSEELKKVIETKTIEEVEEVIESVKLTSNGSVNSTYVLNALNARKSFIADKTAGNVNPLKFNNFEPRQYNYDALEAMLLGHKEYDENDIHEVLSNSNAGNYTSNNSKRFMNGVQIGA